MRIEHFEEYFSELYRLEIEEKSGESVFSGKLIYKTDPEHQIPIVKGIPRFVGSENYSDNFGLQWNLFKATQLDSQSGLSLTRDRFWQNTKWSSEELAGKKVLEVGSGAGRFTEVLLAAGAKVVSFDYSSAVDANYSSNVDKGDMLLFQANVYGIPFKDEIFDYVFCYGVLQHTPDPVKAFECIFSKLKPGGKISVDYYEKMSVPSVWYHPKHFWRPITRKMNPRFLLGIIKFYIPLYLPVDTLIKTKLRRGYEIAARIPIPCWNYLTFGLSSKQRKEWAIMDTFDALGATYDEPKTKDEVFEMVNLKSGADIEVFHGSNGIVANLRKETR